MSAYDPETVRHFADQLAKGVVITDKGQRDLAAQLRAASQRIERLERALREIQEVDERSMYERCPDCDYGHQCTVSKRCIAMPHSKAGEIARSALSTDQGGADR